MVVFVIYQVPLKYELIHTLLFSAENSISARCDLNPRNGSYPFSALGHRYISLHELNSELRSTNMIPSFANMITLTNTNDQPLIQRSHGGTDMKVTSSVLARTLEFVAQSGPTWDPLPPFRWADQGFQHNFHMKSSTNHRQRPRLCP